MADVDSLAQNRRRGRDEGRDASHAGHDQHDSGEPSHSQSDSVKKRKRTRKGDSEKKFECKHEGCGKSYSRAEHLYRHQLNRKLPIFCLAKCPSLASELHDLHYPLRSDYTCIVLLGFYLATSSPSAISLSSPLIDDLQIRQNTSIAATFQTAIVPSFDKISAFVIENVTQLMVRSSKSATTSLIQPIHSLPSLPKCETLSQPEMGQI